MAVSEFTRYRNVAGFQKSARFLEWAKHKYPGKDLHHIFGSFLGKKMTDYLVVPLEHRFHLQAVTGNEGKFFLTFLPDAVSILLEYLSEVHNKEHNLLDLEPESIKRLVETVSELDNC